MLALALAHNPRRVGNGAEWPGGLLSGNIGSVCQARSSPDERPRSPEDAGIRTKKHKKNRSAEVVFKQEFDDVAADSASPIRYRTRPGVDFTTAADPKTGAHQFFAKDRASGETYHIGEEELFICQLLDGTRSLDEIQAAFKGRFGLKLTQKQFSEFLRELDAAGFLTTTEGAAPATRQPSDAGPAERADAAEPTTPFHFRLFNPAPLFGACAWLFRPLRFFVWLLPPATLLAGLILFHRRVDIFVGHDIIAYTATALLAASLATLLITNLLARIVQGSVARAFGATIKDFGITFSLGVIPGFYIDRRSINLLTHRERVWCHAAPLLARLAFFVIGTFLWVSLRPSASGLSEVAFLVGQIGFWSLNLGLAWMVFATLFPLGILQLYHSISVSYYDARTLNYIGSRANTILEWLRMPGDIVFIVGGALPILYLTYLGIRYMRSTTTTEEPKDILFTDIVVPAQTLQRTERETVQDPVLQR